jgi:hypothetical protein
MVFMVNIIKQEVVIEESLKKKLELICEFSNTKPKIINGNIRNIEHTNLSYIEPHRVIIKGITFLVFNYNNINLNFFKQQYDPEVIKKREKSFKGFNLFNKKEIDKATKHINDEMDEYAEELYETKKYKDYLIKCENIAKEINKYDTPKIMNEKIEIIQKENDEILKNKKEIENKMKNEEEKINTILNLVSELKKSFP